MLCAEEMKGVHVIVSVALVSGNVPPIRPLKSCRMLKCMHANSFHKEWSESHLTFLACTAFRT